MKIYNYLNIAKNIIPAIDNNINDNDNHHLFLIYKIIKQLIDIIYMVWYISYYDKINLLSSKKIIYFAINKILF